MLKNMEKLGKNSSQLTQENQNYYFYYGKLFNKKDNNNSLIGKFNGISKLIKLYDKKKNESENFDFISKQILIKLKNIMNLINVH